MYNNPYLMNASFPGNPTNGFGRLGLFRSLRTIDWGNLLNNTQKTLGIINQAIPIAYQVKPIMNNAKTMFRIMGAMHDNSPSQSEEKAPKVNVQTQDVVQKQQGSNQPMFFI